MSETQEVTIEPKVFEFDKFRIRLLTMFKTKYILWPDPHFGPKGFRWSRRVWHDDGMGTPTHGAEYSLQDAAQAVVNNHALREELEREAQS